MKVRRIVTGHDADGKAVFVSDGTPPRTHVFEHVPGHEVSRVWATDPDRQPSLDGADPTLSMTSSLPRLANSTRLAFVQIPPATVMANLDAEKAMAEQAQVSPELLETYDADDAAFHRTETVDYILLLEGELVLELDDGAETVLHPGDVVIQNATRHAWRNRTDAPAVFAGVMIGRPLTEG